MILDGAEGEITELPIHRIPMNLSMPNSKFDILLDRASGDLIAVLRKNEFYGDRSLPFEDNSIG